jgi:hypothetical protein
VVKGWGWERVLEQMRVQELGQEEVEYRKSS